MTINDFTKLDFTEKMSLIEQKAQLIDSYTDNNQNVKTYHLFDFFAEVMVNNKNQFGADVIPYKRCFKLNDQRESSLLSA